MITFDEPMSWQAALDILDAKHAIPTDLSSAEIRDSWDAELRQRSLFSARLTKANILQEFRDQLGGILNGRRDQVTARAEIREMFDRLRYDPTTGFPDEENPTIPPAEDGSLQDLSSEARVDLVLDTNSRQVANFAFREQGQNEFSLYAFPCYELVRIYARHVPRGERLRQGVVVPDPGEDWPSRWAKAGGQFYAARMMARKDDDIWNRLGSTELFRDGLDSPVPPFAFGSGYGWSEVRRDLCISLGVIDAGTDVGATKARMNAGLQADANKFDADFLKAVQADLRTLIEAKRLKLAANVFNEADWDRRKGRFASYHGPHKDDAGGAAANHPIDAKTPLVARDAADLMRRNPGHPTTKAFVSYFEKGHAGLAPGDGKRIDAMLRRLPPYRPGQPLYRGLSKHTLEERDALASEIRDKGSVEMSRWVTSGSKDAHIASAFAAAKGNGVILAAVKVRDSARDMQPIAQVLAPGIRHQAEVAFLKGSKFRVTGEKTTQIRTGATPLFSLEESE